MNDETRAQAREDGRGAIKMACLALLMAGPGGAAMVLWTLLRSAVITVGDAAVLFGAVCVAMAGGGAAVYAAYRLAEDRLIDRAAEYGYLDDTEDTA